MTRMLPRTTWGLQTMTTVLLLLCLVGLAFGKSIKNKERGNKGKNRGQIPAAHLEATTPINGSLIWTNNTESTFVHGDISLINNEVHINQKGLYFVYTQATFDIIACPKKISFLLSHAVILTSIRHGDKIQLLHAQKTVCEEKNAGPSRHIVGLGWRKSLFQGGVFQLEKDDVLYTHTSEMSYLMGQDGATYFGLYAL
ncbi:lymphotoxin-alpha-like [Mantella aurantiaca]